MQFNDFFVNQFLLCKNKIQELEEHWNTKTFSEYNLYTHPQLNISEYSSEQIEIVLLGEIYDYENTSFNNQEILNFIINSNRDKDQLINSFDRTAGVYVLLVNNKKRNNFYIFNDNAALREVFFTVNVNKSMVIGSQPKLITKYFNAELDDSDIAKEFFELPYFNQRRAYINDATEYVNIKHLKPNHYLSPKNGRQKRFFPTSPLQPNNDIKSVAKLAAKMILGFMTAASHRNNILLAVTAGWESRILLASSLNFKSKCHYFVFKNLDFHDKHFDLEIPRRLSKKFKFDLDIIEKPNLLNDTQKEVMDESLSFPRKERLQYIFNFFGKFKNYVTITGNVSEVARMERDRIKSLTPEKLSILDKYPLNPYFLNQYHNWFNKEATNLIEKNYNLLDILYWEESSGNWTAKFVTESNMATNNFLPFNSRLLLENMLAVPDKHRLKQNPKLYKLIIKEISPECLDIPINPGFKKTVIKILQKLNLYSLYRNIVINIQLKILSKK